MLTMPVPTKPSYSGSECGSSQYPGVNMARCSSSYNSGAGHSADRSRSPPRKRSDQSSIVTESVNLDGVAAEVLADDDEELRRLNGDGSVRIKWEGDRHNLKLSFSGPGRNVYDIMMALYRYLKNTKNIECPR